ncbi:diphthine synthase [Candidatus Woesearchaeota archaeon]|nr:diphthine synthase [Candidatus Woesearchaeota archaeon]
MTLYLIGLGVDNEKDITLKGLEAVKKCGKIYLENYTSVLNCSVSDLEKLYGKKIILADRDMIENKAEDILKESKKNDIGLLVIGDPFSATTHTDLVLRAKEHKVKIEVIHNTSILNAVGEVGLELYKYGKTTSIPFPARGFEPETPYDVIRDNQKIGLHTLVLLDLRPDEDKFMSAAEGVKNLLDIEKKRGEKVFTEDTLCIACARIGSENSKIKYGKAKDLLKMDLGKGMQCLIVPGKLHFVEEEMVEKWK